MEWQILFNVAMAALGFVLGYMVNRLFHKLDALTTQDAKLTQEINSVKISLPTNYVTKQDMEHFKADMDTIARALFIKLDKISDKLNGKVDKADAHL